MKILTTFIAISVSSISFAQDCCNVIDTETTNVVTSNGNCVTTKGVDGDCEKGYLAMTYAEPKLKSYEIEILNNALRGVKFKTDSDKLLSKSFPKLHEVAGLMKQHPDFVLIIDGYTDNTGTSEYNHALSHERANAAKMHLVEVDHIDSDRITTHGYGEENPVATNETEEGKAKNRRVEFKVYLKK